MRLFQVIAGGEYGGFEKFCVSLSTEMARTPGLEQLIATRAWPARMESFAKAGIATVPMKFGGGLDILSRFAVGREMARFQPDIVLTWANRAASKTPRGVAPICGRVGHYYKLKYYTGVDFIITNTEGLRRYVVDGGFPADRVETIPNFHNTTNAEPVERGTLSTPPDVPLVVAVGRLHPAKGFDVLLHAMTELKDAYLWLAGAGPEEAALRSLADELGLEDRVRFLGWRNDIEALMRAGDVVAMPSRSEGIGTVFIEAWASGTPLVATASEGPAEFVTDGENGRLVAIDDVAALAGALGDVLNDRPAAAGLAKAARDYYQQNFTSEKIATRYRQTLEAFAATGPRTGPARLSLKSTDTRATERRAAMAPGKRHK